MSRYCVYFTTYSGQLMPPFYIGSKSVKDVVNGYHGSARSKEWKEIWNEEIKNNPNLFHTKIVSLHKTRKEAFTEEEIYQRDEEVVPNLLYVNECYANGNFSNVGKKVTEETRKKMSNSSKNKPKSEDHKKNLRKPKSEEARKNMRGKKNWSIESRSNQRARMMGENNPMFGKPNPFLNRKHTQETIDLLIEKCSKRVICPHCRIEGGITAMYRWHFNNCKNSG